MSVGLVMYYGVGIAAIGIAAMLAFIVALRRGWSVPRGVLIGMMVVVPPMLLTQQLLKHASLHMYADFSHWLQLLHAIATTGKPYVFSHELLAPGTLNYLSVHFVPLIYVFALPFKLLPYPQTLIVLNVLVMSSAAIPLYLLAKHRTGDRHSALFIAALLLWYPTFQYTTLYEFEMLRFSIPILFWMLYAWERQRIGWYYTLVILATLIREEVGLTVGMFGVYLFLFERRRTHGLATALLGFGAFTFITSIIMPTLRGPGAEAYIAQGFFNSFGTTPVEVILGLLQHPFRALAFAADPIKLANLGMLFLPLLFLPLLAPTALIPAFATFAIGLVSSSASYTHTSYMLYYVAPAVPFLFWAFVRAWPRLMTWFLRWTHARDGMDVIAHSASLAILAGLLGVHVFFGPSPLSFQFWHDRFRPAPFKTQSFHRSTYVFAERRRSMDSIVARIPYDAIVSTQQFLMPRLFRARGVMTYPQLVSRDGTHRAEYVLIDFTNNGLRAESPARVPEAEFDLVRADAAQREFVVQQDGYALYRLRP